MTAISENLQTIKSSTDAIKQAIIDKGGTISGDITTWADAISGIETGGGSDDSTPQIKCFSIGGIGKFPYEVGMTWAEFLDSEYGKMCTDTGGIYIALNDTSNIVQTITAGGMPANLKKPNGPNYIDTSELIDETITDYTTYVDVGGGGYD